MKNLVYFVMDYVAVITVVTMVLVATYYDYMFSMELAFWCLIMTVVDFAVLDAMNSHKSEEEA